jgi:hypothetical protein
MTKDELLRIKNKIDTLKAITKKLSKEYRKALKERPLGKLVRKNGKWIGVGDDIIVTPKEPKQ